MSSYILKRQKIGKSMRDSHIEILKQEKRKQKQQVSAFNKVLQEDIFITLYEHITNPESILALLKYLQECETTSLCMPFVFRKLQSIIKMAQDEMEQILPQFDKKLVAILGKVINLNSKSSQQSHPLSQCFAQLVELLSLRRQEYFCLWQQMSDVQDQVISRYTASYFLLQVRQLTAMNDQQVHTFLVSFHNYTSRKIIPLDFMKILHYAGITQQILDDWTLSDYDFMLVINAAYNCIEQKESNYRISCLNQQNFFQSVFVYLQKNIVTKYNTIMRQSFCCRQKNLYGGIFEVNELMQNLRMLLPVPDRPNEIMSNPCSTRQLVHTHTALVRSVLFVLSNIVGTARIFVQKCLLTDLYDCFLYMYDLMPKEVHEQISICLYNMIVLCENADIQIMYERGLMDLIELMMRSHGSVLEQCLGILKRVHQKVGCSQNWGLNHSRLKEEFLDRQFSGILEGFLFHENQSISQNATYLLNAIASDSPDS